MELVTLHDKAIIFQFLERNPGLYAYLIGDLDDFFWPKTIWFGLLDQNKIQSIALIYVGMPTPTLLLFCEGETNTSHQLLVKIQSKLPITFNAHLTPGLISVIGKENIQEHYGFCRKMVLTKKVEPIGDENIRKLTNNDLPTIYDFYKQAYPNNWFDSRMLETGKYFGYFKENRLVGISGIHVYSKKYKVAALGNIATHPDFRGQQIGYRLTSTLCYDLQKSVDVIV